VNRPVAIIGFSFRLPGGSGDDLWARLEAGEDLVTEVPEDRWAKNYFFHPDKTEPGCSYTFAAGTLGDITGFDAGFFGISPREALQMDPQQRLLLEMAWEAFESGGIPPSSQRGSRTAVYVGYSGSDYSYRQADDLSRIDAASMTGNTGSIAANRLSYWFDLRGPSMAVDTACSSSLVAFHQAWQAIQVGDVKQALVAGIALHLHPMAFVGFSKASMLSPNGRCRVFDASGDGYVRSEGGGVFLLKDLAAAEADGDRIFAVVAGVGSNCDGRTNGMTIPSHDAQAQLLVDVYERAGIAPDDVDYVEAHGTGTAVGDPIEAASIATALGKPRRSGRPLPIGSVKSNLGHLETASGVAGLVKALYCLQHRAVPASLHLETLNPNIPFDDWKLEVVTERRALPATGELTIGVNSFGFGGANAHVVLRSYEGSEDTSVAVEDRAERLPAALLLSAADRPALRELAGRYATMLRLSPHLDPYTLAFNAFRRREHLPQRLLVPATDLATVERMLTAYSRGEVVAGAVDGETQVASSPPVFVYSGNGSQWIGMGQALLAHDPVFRAGVETVDRMLVDLGGPSVLEVIGQSSGLDGYEMTEIAQPTLFAIQVGITSVLRRRGIEPVAVIGHSVGEVAAAWAAGALTLEQAVLVIHVRSQAQGRTKGDGAMTAVALSEAETAALLGELDLDADLTIAGVNSPRGVTVAGDPAALSRLESHLEEHEVFHRRLDLDYAFHSAAMDPIRSEVVGSLATLEPMSGDLAFASTVTGGLLSGNGLDAGYWWRNIREPVRFREAIEALIEKGFNLFVEVGPHPILRNYVTDTLRDAGVDGRVIETLVRDDERPERLDEAAGKVLLAAPDAVWARFFDRPAAFIDLPRYAWQRDRFWPSPSVEGSGYLQRWLEHPYLGFRESPDRLAWEGRLDLRLLPDLEDHRVGDSVLFPAAGFVELVLAASARMEPAGHYEVQDLEIFAPLILEADSARRIRCSVDSRDGRFEISSNVRLSEEPWLHHAVGRLTPAPDQVPMPPLVLPERPFDFDAAEHYALTEKVGLQYGPSYQVVEGVWVDGDSLTGRLRVPDAEDLEQYHLLPALLDGCFQVLADHSAEDIRRGDADAHVPVRIDRLLLLQSGKMPRFACGRLVSRSPRSAVVDFDLFDVEKKLVARVFGARFKRVRLVKEKANRQWLGYGLLPRPRPLSDSSASLALPADLAELAAQRDPALAGYFDEFLPLLDILCAAYTERAVRDISKGLASLSTRALIADGRLHASRAQLFEHLLDRLLDDDAIEQAEDGMRWVPDAGLPDPEMIWQRMLRDYPDHAAQVLLVGRAGRCLPRVLSGELDGESLVDDWSDGPVLDSYLRGSVALRMIDQHLGALIDRLIADCQASGAPLRMLLVIDSRTLVTAQLLRRLDIASCELTIVCNTQRQPDSVDSLLDDAPDVELVEVAFEQAAEQWPLEELVAQDLVVLDHAVSRFSDPESALRRLRQMLRRDGLMVVAEQPPAAWADFVFGLSSGWWSAGYHHRPALGNQLPGEVEEVVLAAGFADPEFLVSEGVPTELAPYLLAARSPDAGAELPPPSSMTCLVIQDTADFSARLAEGVRERLQASGCRVIPVIHGSRVSDSGTVFHVDVAQEDGWSKLLERLQASSIIPEAVLWLAGITPDQAAPMESATWSSRQAARCAALGELFTALAAAELSPDCWLLTSGAFSAETPAQTDSAFAGPSPDSLVWGFGRCIANEYPAISTRLVDLAAPHHLTMMCDALVAEVLNPTDDDEIVLTEQGRRVGRVTIVGTDQPRDAGLAGWDEAVLNFDVPGALTGLRWEMQPGRRPGEGEVAIDVKSAGLNFRDVMYAMGLLSDEAVEAGFAGATLGMELSGVVAEVGKGVTNLTPGDAVIAFSPASFATRAVTSAGAVIAKPESWSFEAAATVPTTFFTVFYALRELARLQPGERVLIHGAAGGVGIAAIQLAQHLGAEVFATAGSPDKRDFVRQLGVDHVFDSRALEFADQILDCTGGEGVDVVLNSLAGEAINRNLRVLRPFGRFLELGKRDFYENTRIGLRPFRNNISYFGIDADQLMAERPALTQRLFHELFALFEADVLKPLPYTCFAADDAVDAFRFMQQSKQVGKVVLTFERPPRAQVSRSPRPPGPRLSADATYLVTGGTSGFGAATARWLVDHGARHLLLLSRRGPDAPGVEELSMDLQATGAAVRVLACDVSDGDEVATALATIDAEMPALRGIIHAAMVIDDGLISDLNAQRIAAVFAPKVQGAVHLDRLTRGMALDFFVVYSSATTTFGNPGQASYVAANRFIEYLVERRRAEGLAGLAIGWGPLEDVGYLSRNSALGEALESRLGGRSLTSDEALESLGQLLLADQSGVAVLNFDWGRLRRSLPASSSKRFLALEALAGGADDFDELNEIRDLLLQMPEDDAVEVLVKLIRQDVGQILRLDPERIDPQRSIQEFGMDSLMAMELAVTVEKRLGVQLPVMMLGEGPSIHRLSERIVAIMRKGIADDDSNARIEENVRALAAQHGQAVNDPEKLKEFVQELTASPATRSEIGDRPNENQ
jgi:acyl transferase domain-containing protein/NADPH:quinone reductase-like Zn-dependent oxidoreductase/acyl carrier protein